MLDKLAEGYYIFDKPIIDSTFSKISQFYVIITLVKLLSEEVCT